MFLKLKDRLRQYLNSQSVLPRWDFAAVDIPFSSDRLERYQQRVKKFRTTVRFALTAPVIWSGLLPAVLMDVFVTVYQAVCFPVYGLEKVKRSEYFRYEREQLEYLTLLEKINCYYCSYFNGLVAYTREVAARTESYWCPLKHKKRLPYSHNHYQGFAEFGDEVCFRRKKNDDF